MNDKFFLDSNVCIYAFDRDSKKKEKALDLIVSNQATVSTQVLMETANVAGSNSYNGSYTEIQNSNVSGTNTTDIPPSSGTYYYKVEAHRSSNPSTKSDLSNYASANYIILTRRD